MNPALGEQDARLAPEEIADLGRFWSTYFASAAATAAGLERYKRELTRQAAAWASAGLGDGS